MGPFICNPAVVNLTGVRVMTSVCVCVCNGSKLPLELTVHRSQKENHLTQHFLALLGLTTANTPAVKGANKAQVSYDL